MTTEYEYNDTDDGSYEQADSQYDRYQTFTVGATGHTITAFHIYGKANSGATTLYWYIATVDANNYPHTAILSGSVDISGWNTNDADRTINVTETALSANTKYCIVLGDGNAGWQWKKSTANPYSGGLAGYNPYGWYAGYWVAESGSDFRFQIWVNPSFVEYLYTFNEYLGSKDTLSSKFKSVIKTIAQYMAGKDTLTGHAHAVNITGYTRDSNGTPLGSVTVYLYRTSDDALIGSTTSNASTGAYAFNNVPYTNYYLVAMLKGSPDKFGCTDNNIT